MMLHSTLFPRCGMRLGKQRGLYRSVGMWSCMYLYVHVFFLEGECFYKWITLREIEI